MPRDDRDLEMGSRKKCRSHHLISFAVLASTLGSTFEWFDFAIYAYIAPDIGAVFFTGFSEAAALNLANAVLAVTYLARPLGGVLIAHVGDVRGRKVALQLSVALMSLSSLLLGLCPGYDMIGAAAPALLLLLRTAQGLSVGGQCAGAQVLTYESTPARRRGFSLALLDMASGLGFSLAAAAAAALDALPDAERRQWGWRVPFLAGLPLGLLVCWLQARADESPEFVAAVAGAEVSEAKPEVEAEAEVEAAAEAGVEVIVVDMTSNAVLGSFDGDDRPCFDRAFSGDEAASPVPTAQPQPQPQPSPSPSQPPPPRPAPLAAALRRYGPLRLAAAAAPAAAVAVCAYLVSTWVPLYCTTLAPPAARAAESAATGGNGSSNWFFRRAHAVTAVVLLAKAACFTPLAGLVVDRAGAARALGFSLAALAVLLPLMMRALEVRRLTATTDGVATSAYSVPSAATALAWYVLAPLPLAAAVPALQLYLSSLFADPRLRYSAVALAYNSPLAVFGGTVNLVATALYRHSGGSGGSGAAGSDSGTGGSTFGVGAYASALCAVAVGSLLLLERSRAGLGLRDKYQLQPQVELRSRGSVNSERG